MARAPSMADIARLVGVSKNTVSLAMRHSPQIPESTRRRIAEAANRLGYAKNPTVACLMAELRRAQQPEFQASLALVNANRAADAFLRHPTIPTYVEGCRRRAAQLGYSLDEFWLHGLRPPEMLRIFSTRNLRGVILVGLMDENRLPPEFRPVWEAYPTVVTGVRTHDPALPFACADHHMLVMRAFEQAWELGYRRPALVLDRVIDRLVDGRFGSGFYAAETAHCGRGRAGAFFFDGRTDGAGRDFETWYTRQRPDVILTLYNGVQSWLREMRVQVPRDVGLIQLEWRAAHPEWAGMNQHNDVAGEAAVEMVISMIQNGYAGLPEFPRATLIGSNWVPGRTVRRQPAKRR